MDGKCQVTGASFAIGHGICEDRPNWRRGHGAPCGVTRSAGYPRPAGQSADRLAGKSSIGRRLADKLELPFVDADQEIERAAGKSIPEIFADHGETYFREGERRVIARLMENGAQVLATGGGAYMNAETRAMIAERGIAIWLKAGIDLLMKRVAKRGDRPLLKNGDPDTVMRRLMTERYPVYAEADITIESKDVQHAEMVNAVIGGLAAWQGWDKLAHV
jgi:shikimate kinase